METHAELCKLNDISGSCRSFFSISQAVFVCCDFCGCRAAVILPFGALVSNSSSCVLRPFLGAGGADCCSFGLPSVLPDLPKVRCCRSYLCSSPAAKTCTRGVLLPCGPAGLSCCAQLPGVCTPFCCFFLLPCFLTVLCVGPQSAVLAEFLHLAYEVLS